MLDLTYEPYAHPAAPVMTASEQRAWIEPEPPRYERTEYEERAALEYEERREREASER